MKGILFTLAGLYIFPKTVLLNSQRLCEFFVSRVAADPKWNFSKCILISVGIVQYSRCANICTIKLIFLMTFTVYEAAVRKG